MRAKPQPRRASRARRPDLVPTQEAENFAAAMSEVEKVAAAMQRDGTLLLGVVAKARARVTYLEGEGAAERDEHDETRSAAERTENELRSVHETAMREAEKEHAAELDEANGERDRMKEKFSDAEHKLRKVRSDIGDSHTATT